MTAIPGVIVADKASGTASKALTGDIYTREWTTTKTVGKGKKKRTVTTHHSLRTNPVSVGLGLIAIAGAGLLGAGAVWLTQMKLGPKPGKGANCYVNAVRTSVATKDKKEQWRIVVRCGAHTKTLTYEGDIRGAQSTINAATKNLMSGIKPYDWSPSGAHNLKATASTYSYNEHFYTQNGTHFTVEEREGFSGGLLG